MERTEVASRFRDGKDGGARPLLDVMEIDDVLEHVDRLGTPTWLTEGLFPGDAYGVLGAEDKALKTWNGVDLLVSVACGRPWVGRFPCPQGPVTAFLGEGGPRNFLRRAEAVCTSKGLSVVDLIGQMRVCFTAPRLRDKGHLGAMQDEFAKRPPKLALVDPLYLSAVGAKGSDLYAMGELLGDVQRLTQDVGAALIVITHWNKGGVGNGPERFTGVGPGAWGRVLGSAQVERRGQDPDGSNVVQLRWEFRGSEIPDTVFRARYRVRSEDPHSLTARLFYDVEVTSESEETTDSESRVVAVLAETGIEGLTVREIGDGLATDGRGHPLTKRTIQRVVRDLLEGGRIDGTEGEKGRPGRWWLT